MYHSIFYYYTLTCILLLQLSVPTVYVMVTDVCLTVQRKVTYKMLTTKQTKYLERLFVKNENIDGTTKCEVAEKLGLAEEKVCMCERTHSFSCFLHCAIPHSIVAPTTLQPTPLGLAPSCPLTLALASFTPPHPYLSPSLPVPSSLLPPPMHAPSLIHLFIFEECSN